MRAEYIAKVCHELNLIFCESIGDSTQVPWDEAPVWQKDSAIHGVQFIIDNPKTTPEELHNEWMAHKFDDGWVYGPTKDLDAKTHPCLLPYRALPEQQKTKDKLFRKVVELLK